MSEEPANANEGADPSKDIKQQNPGETTTASLAARKEPQAPDVGTGEDKSTKV